MKKIGIFKTDKKRFGDVDPEGEDGNGRNLKNRVLRIAKAGITAIAMAANTRNFITWV
ncbi:hypothetical protein ACL6C3_31090 [Capilliphycus salinus ALCB114379]|uniref:hypothetical protein n=1 Tax=Capilliphycus salinus TaxID=2768948 RepID=UPI0039A4E052